MKKNLLEALERKDDNAIDIFLTSMGHNVSSALMSGRGTEYKETRSKDTCSNAQDSNDISNWVPSNEQSALEVLENIDTYEKRNIGSSKKPEWHKEKCISCNFGFNTRSIPIKCDKCGKFVHVKAMCLKDHNGKHHCKKCLPAEILSNEAEVDVANFMSVVENGFKCTKCDLVTKSKFNLKRHIYRVHAFNEPATQDNVVEIQQDENTNQSIQFLSIEDILKDLSMECYKELFDKNDIDLFMLQSLNEDEFLNMFQSIGITSWGHRLKLKKGYSSIKFEQL